MKVLGSWSLRHRNEVQDVTLAGELLASAGTTEVGFRLWSGATGEPVGKGKMEEEGTVSSLASSADGNLLYAGFATGVCGWNVTTRQSVVWIHTRAKVQAITVTSDGNLAFAAGRRAFLERADGSGPWADLKEGHTGNLDVVVVSADRKHPASHDTKRLIVSSETRVEVWSSGADKKGTSWDLRDGTATALTPKGRAMPAWLTPDARFEAFWTGTQGKLVLHDRVEQRDVGELEGFEPNQVCAFEDNLWFCACRANQ